MQNITENLNLINQNIEKACKKAGRTRDSVSLVVVTKTATIEQIKEVVRLGYTELGESRLSHFKTVATEIQDFLEQNQPCEDLPKKVNWHMIGHLQRNKVKQILPMARLIQSVDTLRLAEEITENAVKMNVTANVLLQVNCSEEVQKYGVPVGAATHLAEQICSMPNMKLLGIMTMAPFTEDETAIRTAFSRAKDVFEDIKMERFTGREFQHLSMGMSNDYEIAIEEGATILRIGSAIFN